MKSIYEFLLKSKTATSTQDADYVDLGLPSGLLWAKCNIGAEKPYEYGDYFMWGSTEPDTDKPCNWKHTPFNDGIDDYDKGYFYFIKNKVCPNDVLAPEYDAVTVTLRNDWRLPTDNDFAELIDNITHEWINNYQGSNIDGILFQANDAELFIPAAGYRSGSSLEHVGSYVCLWSSSLNRSTQRCARYFCCYDSSCHIGKHGVRYYGFCLRGVKKI